MSWGTIVTMNTVNPDPLSYFGALIASAVPGDAVLLVALDAHNKLRVEAGQDAAEIAARSAVETLRTSWSRTGYAEFVRLSHITGVRGFRGGAFTEELRGQADAVRLEAQRAAEAELTAEYGSATPVSFHAAVAVLGDGPPADEFLFWFTPQSVVESGWRGPESDSRFVVWMTPAGRADLLIDAVPDGTTGMFLGS